MTAVVVRVVGSDPIAVPRRLLDVLEMQELVIWNNGDYWLTYRGAEWMLSLLDEMSES